MENLKIVRFTLEGQEEMSVGDYWENMPEEKTEEITKLRNGYFHTWGNESFWNLEEGKSVERVIGVVEEIETGIVYHVIPKRITFVQPDSFHLV